MFQMPPQQQQPVYGMPTNQNCNDDKSTNAHPQPATNETPYANGTVAADGVKVCSFFSFLMHFLLNGNFLVVQRHLALYAT